MTDAFHPPLEDIRWMIKTKTAMNLSSFIIAGSVIYIIDVFALIWLSVRFIGIEPVPKKDLAALGAAILLLTWLVGTGVYHVPLVIKPFLLFLGFGAVVAFFAAILETQTIKALAAGMFFLLCQAALITVLLRQLWSEKLLQIIRYMLFDAF